MANLRARFAAGLSAGKGIRSRSIRGTPHTGGGHNSRDDTSSNGFGGGAKDGPVTSGSTEFTPVDDSPPQAGNRGGERADSVTNNGMEEDKPPLERRAGSRGPNPSLLAVPGVPDSDDEEVEDTALHSVGDASSVKQILERRYAALKKGRGGHARTPSRVKRQELLRQTSIMRRSGFARTGSNVSNAEESVSSLDRQGSRGHGLPPPSLKDMDDSPGSDQDYSDRDWEQQQRALAEMNGSSRDRGGNRKGGRRDSQMSGEDEDNRDDVDDSRSFGLDTSRDRRMDTQGRRKGTPRSSQRTSTRALERLHDDMAKMNNVVHLMEDQQAKFVRETRKAIENLASKIGDVQRQHGQLKAMMVETTKKVTQVERKYKSEVGALTEKIRDRSEESQKHEKTPGQDLKAMLLQYFITGVSTIIAIVMAPFSAVYDAVTDFFQPKKPSAMSEHGDDATEDYDYDDIVDYLEDADDATGNGTSRSHRRPPRSGTTPRVAPRRDKTRDRDREREREREREWDADSTHLDSGTAANSSSLGGGMSDRNRDRDELRDKFYGRDWTDDF